MELNFFEVRDHPTFGSHDREQRLPRGDEDAAFHVPLGDVPRLGRIDPGVLELKLSKPRLRLRCRNLGCCASDVRLCDVQLRGGGDGFLFCRVFLVISGIHCVLGRLDLLRGDTVGAHRRVAAIVAGAA